MMPCQTPLVKLFATWALESPPLLQERREWTVKCWLPVSIACGAAR
jgi:hypothetical protein